MMRLSQVKSIILLSLGVFILVMSGFASAIPPGKIVWQLEEQFISLVPQDNQGSAAENNQPAEVSVDMLGKMLFAISISEKKKTRFSFDNKKVQIGSPLFTEDEVEKLAEIFVQALASASPREDILFRSHGGKQALGGIARFKKINTGRAFWLDNKLNIIFGEVHSNSKTKWVYGKKQKDTAKRIFGSRTRESEKVEVAFIEAPGISYYNDSHGKMRSDWIVIDPHALAADHVELPAKQHKEGDRQVEKPIAVQQQTTDITTPSQSLLKQQLQELKELREQDLITEEIYQRKIKQLVDEAY